MAHMMKFIATTKDKLDTLSIKAGQLIFVQDERAIYLDTDKRTSYQAIINVIDDDHRLNLVSPVSGFYYVQATSVLWSFFDGTWKQLTGSDSSIVFADKENFPEIGNDKVLYVDGTLMYRWNIDTSTYELMTGGAGSVWEEM